MRISPLSPPPVPPPVQAAARKAPTNRSEALRISRLDKCCPPSEMVMTGHSCPPYGRTPAWVRSVEAANEAVNERSMVRPLASCRGQKDDQEEAGGPQEEENGR